MVFTVRLRNGSAWKEPLLKIDAKLGAFAAATGMELSKNYHNWPERSLERGNGIRRLIQIYLADERNELQLVGLRYPGQTAQAILEKRLSDQRTTN